MERNDNKQVELKQLYFLHIPKTAGKYVSENIKRSLDANDISYYISTHHPNNNNFAKKFTLLYMLGDILLMLFQILMLLQ